MPLSPELVTFLTKAGHDAIHAIEVGLGTAPDKDILERARKEHRIIVTADLDYPRLLALLQSSEPGVILFRKGNFSDDEVRELLSRILDKMKEEDLKGSIVVVETHRIRRRKLPL